MSQNKNTNPRVRGSSFSLLLLLQAIFFSLLSFIFIKILIDLVQRYWARIRYRIHPVIEIELEDEVVAEAVIETKRETDTSIQSDVETVTIEREVSFTFPPVRKVTPLEAPVVIAPPKPDLYLTVPPDVIIESYEPSVLVDGKSIKVNFNWQNPTLLNSIYPFRKQKLMDFLLYFTEINLVDDYGKKGESHPDIQNKLNLAKGQIATKRVEVKARLEQLIDAKKKSDTWFAKITGQTPQSLRFRQTYYIDRQIVRAEDKLDDVKEQKEGLLKRVNWYAEGDPRQDTWKERAAKLDPEIGTLQNELNELNAQRKLFNEEAALPSENVNIKDLMRWEMSQQKEKWEKLNQTQLLKEIIDWINLKPDQFPEWLIYMVIHFSGMRYMSAHSSWADPRYLLEIVTREDLSDRIKSMNETQVVQECTLATQRLEKQILPAQPDVNKKKSLDRLIQRLKTVECRRALLELSTAEAMEEIQKLPDDDACLKQLVEYRDEKEKIGDPIPDWVWAEICKYTPLRQGTTDPDWEAYSPERWNWQNNHWRDVLVTWEKKDMTAWRQKHKETLDLIVTRAVCNEVSEHIQHLRGVSPAAGLTSKPVWYLRQQTKMLDQAYLVQSPEEIDFNVGASILWLEWVDKEPNAWQVAHPIQGYTLVPGIESIPAGKKGEVRKQKIEEPDAKSWDYRLVNNAYIRLRKKPTRQELKQMGKSEKEITQIMNERKASGEFDKQYLRWRHEAIVFDVVTMIDGKYVMTFETGQIGLNLRRLGDLDGNPLVFVGYVPAGTLPKELDNKLIDMLRWDRILPDIKVMPRIRPKIILDEKVSEKKDEKPIPVGGPPPRKVVATREEIKCFKFIIRDKFGQPKMMPAAPFVKIKLGTFIGVSANHKEGMSDSGNGEINTLQGKFLKVVECADNRAAEGLFIQKLEIADLGAGKWMVVHPQVEKTLCHMYFSRDMQGKPIFKIPGDLNRRIILPSGTKFRISTNHRESEKDVGDGVILATGLEPYYLILECPAIPKAAGWYVQKEDVIPQ